MNPQFPPSSAPLPPPILATNWGSNWSQRCSKASAPAAGGSSSRSRSGCEPRSSSAGTPSGATFSPLNPSLPPSGNFQLTGWNLTLPTGTQGDPTVIPTSQLASGYTSPYFYTGPDGAMVFSKADQGRFPETDEIVSALG